VHRYELSAPDGISIDITLEVTGANWSPVVIVQTVAGQTLYDGEVASVGGGVSIEPLASGQGGNAARLRLTAVPATTLHLFVTSWEVLSSGFTGSMSTGAQYSLSANANCPAPRATCPMDKADIGYFGSGFFEVGDSQDPNSPNYNPYKRDSRSSHSGYDIHARAGLPVYATQSGTIIASVTTNTGDCGRSVNLAADDGVTFRYCHLETVMVASGRVQAGDQIGTNGNTGNAINPHVHFVYLDAPNITTSGTTGQRSAKVNAYIDELCR